MADETLYTVIHGAPLVIWAFASVLYWMLFGAYAMGVRQTAQQSSGSAAGRKAGREYVLALTAPYLVISAMFVWSGWRQLQYGHWLKTGQYEVHKGILLGVEQVSLGPRAKGGGRWEQDAVIVGDAPFIVGCQRGGSDPDSFRCVASKAVGDRVELDYKRFEGGRGMTLQVLNLGGGRGDGSSAHLQ
ncbi:MAG TPA: hypothetical protein VGI79_19000 [Caulobacteraceae bacterium]|jgi:hypothetical protein